MHVTKNMYLDEVYKLCSENFAKFCISVKINAIMIVMVFLWFHHENRLVGNFQIRKYGEFHRNRKVCLFGTALLMGFGSFFFKSHFSRKIMVLWLKCIEH